MTFLTPVFRIILFFLLCIICLVPFVWLAEMQILPPAPNQILEDISSELSVLLATLGGLLMLFHLFPFLDFYAVFIRRYSAIEAILIGGFYSGIAIGACSLALYFSGFVRFELAGVMPWIVVFYVAYYLLIALAEEFLFRSFMLYAFAERYALWFACFFNGLLFMLVHGANPNVSIIGLANIALAGILFSIYTLQKQNIFWAVGIHFGWNLTQGLIFGYQVSGITVPGILKATPQGESFFSGGGFGLEGSVYCSILLVSWIVFLVFRNGWGQVEIYDPKFLEEAEPAENF